MSTLSSTISLQRLSSTFDQPYLSSETQYVDPTPTTQFSVNGGNNHASKVVPNHIFATASSTTLLCITHSLIPLTHLPSTPKFWDGSYSLHHDTHRFHSCFNITLRPWWEKHADVYVKRWVWLLWTEEWNSSSTICMFPM